MIPNLDDFRDILKIYSVEKVNEGTYEAFLSYKTQKKKIIKYTTFNYKCLACEWVNWTISKRSQLKTWVNYVLDFDSHYKSEHPFEYSVLNTKHGNIKLGFDK